MVKIPIVVVTINSEIHLGAWLQSVKILALPEGVQAYPYIVDNGSWDGTPGIIWDAVRDGTVDSNNVVWLDENTGFNRAQNLAFRHLGTRRNVAYVATLNHDATTDQGWLRNLYTAASVPRSHKQCWTCDSIARWCIPRYRLEPPDHWRRCLQRAPRFRPVLPLFRGSVVGTQDD